jgi:hypothetical protein
MGGGDKGAITVEIRRFGESPDDSVDTRGAGLR